MVDKVGSDEDLNTGSVSEEIFISHEDHNQQTKREPLSFLPRLPPLHFPSSVSPPSDAAYLQAAAIFKQLRTERAVTQQHLRYGKKTDTPQPESGDKSTQRQAYHLAFNTLKYQDLLEDIIADSCFHTSQHISSDLLPLAMVMLFDFQNRRFSLRERPSNEGAEPLQEVRDLEGSLQRCKTKLAASLARCRVKHNLQSVSCFLSDPVRTKQHRAKHLPLYSWVNTLKTSVEEVCEAVQSAGLREVQNLTDLRESTFCRDPLCPDTLVFSQQLHALLQHSSLTITHALNTQDRSACVAISVLRPLLFENADVLVVGSFSAVTAAHVAVVAAARSGRVLVCGADHTRPQIEEMHGLLAQMDVNNVRVLSEAFCALHESDAAVQRLKVILVLPRCSSSGLNDPVPTIHSEHGDWELLPELCHSSVSRSKIHTMATQQARLLAHALSFPKVQTVVYCTRSVYPEENEQQVKRVLEKIHTHPKLLPFRVNGPIFPDDTADSKFFRLEPSPFTNGCFTARLSRQADPTKVETVQDVLARAAAKGLLGGIIPEQSKTSKKGKSRKNRAASAGSRPSSPSTQEGQTGSEGKDPDAPSDRAEKRAECSEEEREEDEGGKGEKKRRGLKGGKRKVKQRPKQTNRTPAASKQHNKDLRKRKANPSHPKRRKPRRIPRLTLALISSAKPSNHLSPITTLAHKISDSTAIRSAASPAPPTPHAASQQVQRQNAEPAEKPPRDATKPESPFKAKGKARPKAEQVTQDTPKPSDFVLPPIPASSPSAPSSRSGSSASQHPPNCQLAQISASSSSSVSLPEL